MYIHIEHIILLVCSGKCHCYDSVRWVGMQQFSGAWESNVIAHQVLKRSLLLLHRTNCMRIVIYMSVVFSGGDTGADLSTLTD